MNLPTPVRRVRAARTRSVCIALACLGLAAPAVAADLVGVSAAPNPATTGTTVQVTVQKTGGKCGAEIDFGNGHVIQVVVQAAPFAEPYPNPGAFTITVKGVAHGGQTRCKGAMKTTQLQVNPPSGGGTLLQRGPAGSGALAPRKPKAGATPPGVMRPLPPKAGIATEGPRSMRYKPTIESAVFTAADGGKYSAGLGQLAPRGRLVLVGKGFSDATGAIQIQGLPKGDTFAKVVSWSDTKVVGDLPDHLGGEIEKIYPVAARVLRYAENEWSNPWQLQYQLPFEVKMLSLDDSAVHVVSCGADGNANVCNKVEIGDGCRNMPAQFVPPPSPHPTLYAYHRNCIGAVGDDSGTDRFEIQLAHGWKVRELIDFHREKSSSDESLQALNVAPGQKTFSVDWTVSPGDWVTYWYKINIVGPMGTSHH